MQKYSVIFLSIIVGVLSSSVEKEISYFEDILLTFIISNPNLNKTILGLVIKVIIFVPIILKLFNFV